MVQTRVFVPQEAVESWIGEGRARLTQDSLTLEGHAFTVASAVRFLAEVTGSPDQADLVGRVKSREQLEALAAEHSGESVLLGDNAYQVSEGYLLGMQHAPLVGDPVQLLQKLFARP